MITLCRIAFRHGKHFLLLGVTFTFMFILTASSQTEMMAIGVITKSGSDFFSLFAPEKDGAVEPTSKISLKEVEERWSRIDTEETGEITKLEASRYMSQRKDRNPLNFAMSWMGAHMDFLGELWRLAFLLVLVAIVKGISLFGSQYTKQLVMIRVGRDLRHRYFQHIQTLSMDFYHKFNVGNLVTRVSGDATQIATGVYSTLTTYVQTPIVVVSSLILCFFVSTKLSLLMFVAFPVILGPILFFAKRVKRVARSQQRLGEGFSSTLIDFLSGIQTIKLFAMEPFSLKKFQSLNERQAHLEAKSARYGFLARPVLHMASTFMLASIILFGLYIAEMRVSEILIFCGLVYLMYEPIKRLNDENIQIQKGIVAAERMDEVLSMTPQIADKPDAISLKSFDNSIEFENVWFRYDDRWVLKGVSFSVKKGEIVALVGPTGGGKSTVAQLLPRLYEPEKGTITLDGKPLAEYTQRSLRQQIAFVPQRPFLFLDSVAENIAFGQPYTDKEIQAAGKRAHADEFISALRDGYQTQLAEGGKSLSGGQQQRLAIARALFKRAPILVMDEATSSLDAISENKIKQAMEELRGEMTQVIIAHRLSTVEDADRILVIDGGELIDQGTKDELLERCPKFQLMWQTMFGQEREPAVR